ncbi:MAG TPA: hypothetical protein VFF33_14005 [Ignavibacteriaceae bacterium]|nr:hypothetical protein [Ignavibacteriaceae bacterium]
MAGQKQRVFLARCILNNPSILIFAETFNALDLKIDLEVKETIKTLFSNTTYIFISHGEISNNYYDKIFVIDNETISFSCTNERNY